MISGEKALERKESPCRNMSAHSSWKCMSPKGWKGGLDVFLVPANDKFYAVFFRRDPDNRELKPVVVGPVRVDNARANNPTEFLQLMGFEVKRKAKRVMNTVYDMVLRWSTDPSVFTYVKHPDGNGQMIRLLSDTTPPSASVLSTYTTIAPPCVRRFATYSRFSYPKCKLDVTACDCRDRVMAYKVPDNTGLVLEGCVIVAVEIDKTAMFVVYLPERTRYMCLFGPHYGEVDDRKDDCKDDRKDDCAVIHKFIVAGMNCTPICDVQDAAAPVIAMFNGIGTREYNGFVSQIFGVGHRTATTGLGGTGSIEGEELVYSPVDESMVDGITCDRIAQWWSNFEQ